MIRSFSLGENVTKVFMQVSMEWKNIFNLVQFKKKNNRVLLLREKDFWPCFGKEYLIVLLEKLQTFCVSVWVCVLAWVVVRHETRGHVCPAPPLKDVQRLPWAMREALMRLSQEGQIIYSPAPRKNPRITDHCVLQPKLVLILPL